MRLHTYYFCETRLKSAASITALDELLEKQLKISVIVGNEYPVLQ